MIDIIMGWFEIIQYYDNNLLIIKNLVETM